MTDSTDDSDSLDVNNWHFTLGRLQSGRTPYPDLLAKEILYHEEPMPQSVREFLSDFVLARLQPDIRNLPYEQLNPEEKIRYRRHAVYLAWYGCMYGTDTRSWYEVKTELANEFNKSEETIEKDIRERRNKPKF